MELVKGILEHHSKGFGMLRNKIQNFNPSTTDVYVSPTFIQKLRLKQGLEIEGKIGNSRKNNQMRPLSQIVTINGRTVDDYFKINTLRERVAIDPEEQLLIQQHDKDRLGAIIDGLVPIGKGQRSLIVAPPKAGKTTILKHIANSIIKNHPKVNVNVLLLDERPEEVTDFQRNVSCPIFHSNVDQAVDSHTRMAELVLDRAMRMAEFGEDVVLLVDSLTRMGRAYNSYQRGSGRTLTGGLDSRALEFPRRFFGSARNIEDGGSLAIIASILVDTGSQMDQIIFQEFKGTGNMELVLSRELSERRVFPAIDLHQSGTRKEEKLLKPDGLKRSYIIRRAMHDMSEAEAIHFAFKQLSNQGLLVVEHR
jgi:transcription termination factor Rho